MSGRDPTFVIAGAQRSGSTWLRNLLAAHPDVFMAEPPRPEPKYFCEEPREGRDLEWYRSTWFAGCDEAAAVGEKSTSYIETPGAAGRMRAQLPDLRLVFVLRHPLERAVSNYQFSRAHGVETESLETALRDEEERLRTTEFPEMSAHPFAYLRRGRYADFLDGFLAVFPPEQVAVVTFEDLRDDTRRTLGGLLGFLGVPGDYDPPADADRNAAKAPRDAALSLPADLLEELIAGFAADNARLGDLCGLDVTAWSRVTPLLRDLIR